MSIYGEVLNYVCGQHLGPYVYILTEIINQMCHLFIFYLCILSLLYQNTFMRAETLSVLLPVLSKQFNLCLLGVHIRCSENICRFNEMA